MRPAACLAMLDITAREHAEQTPKQYALELSIKNEHLKEMPNALGKRRDKSQFLARMSHEFRTPG